MKKHGTTILLVFILLVGMSLMLYPSVSDWWNSLHQSQAIASFREQVANLSDEDYNRILAEAKAYNERLAERGGSFAISDAQRAEYNSLLNIAGNGTMGFITIPKIDCTLPVYHGTQESVLQIATGHLEWSSLPVGGVSTHTVVSGHRGLPSAKLFTRLDELKEGDPFILHILDETLTYEVDQVVVVYPEEMDELTLQIGKDLCTLVTCTPYGVNSHRMLVRGHRIDNIEDAMNVRITADAVQYDPLYVAIGIGSAIIIILLTMMMLRGRLNF